jgi:hypothetical protein
VSAVKAACASVAVHIEQYCVRSKNDFVHGLFTRLAVVLGCFAISFATTSITGSIRRLHRRPAATVQTPKPEPDMASIERVKDATDLIPPSLSPYDIRNFINGKKCLDARILWHLLQLDKTDPSSTQQPKSAERRYIQDCSNYEAEAFEYDLDGEPGTEVLLKISYWTGTFTSYLIFHSDQGRLGKWKLLGHIDSENNKYRPSQHKIFMGGGKSWLVISSGGATGTGVATYYDQVFLVNRNGVHEVLGYISEGHQSGSPNNDTREFFGQLVSCEIKADRITAEVAYVVQYFGEDYLGDEDGILLWGKHQRAYFTGWLGNPLGFDSRHSTMSEQELEEVYNIDSLTEEGYFKYNAKELAAIATGRDVKKREWLRRSLAEGEETKEVRRLRRLLTH